MMTNTYLIHIKGLVQGVGFRPFVVRIAHEMNITGWVNNSTNGVMIALNGEEEEATRFYQFIINNPPENAIITAHSLNITSVKNFTGFTIQESSQDDVPDLLLTPDIAMCNDCKNDLQEQGNKRFGYAFTTCINCGPRYSITAALPYDRENTTLNYLPMCPSCTEEYNNINDRRYYSQTNSCYACTIQKHLHYSVKEEHHCSEDGKLNHMVNLLNAGLIIAVKGIGGYLLMCDATNHYSIETLRDRKNRPSKPFAVLYPDIKMALADVEIRSCEKHALESKAAPIVLCKANLHLGNNICKELIAPGLDKIGVMFASTPLLYLLSTHFKKPLIATSANISGAPIIYKDNRALTHLFDVADILLTYDRDILVPQDDSVLQFTDLEEKIILRRSKGLAPNYFPNPFSASDSIILGTGGELKSAFALSDRKNLFVSQFLGDQGIVESQENYATTLHHLLALIKANPAIILLDAHPAYFVAKNARTFSSKFNCKHTIAIQHHKAHFGAVLAENQLLHFQLPVLGVIWDGTGYGDDKKIWGSEFFIYQHNSMQRIAHLKYFPQLAGDKMSKEPRLSALSILLNFPQHQSMVADYFSATEWGYYQKLIQQNHQVWSSSMGRFLDALACILGVKSKHNYEGEALMLLEALARTSTNHSTAYYSMPFENNELNWEPFVQQMMVDVSNLKPAADIAWKIFYSLSIAVQQVAKSFNIKHLAFSGGVFQNALLVDLMKRTLSEASTLYFHQQLSPNDECIGFGQLACFEMEQEKHLRSSFNKVNLSPSFA